MGQCLRGKMAEVGLLPPLAEPQVAETEPAEATPEAQVNVANTEEAVPAEPELDVTPVETVDAVAADEVIAATFGLLRAEPDGSVVIAGSGIPGTSVEVFANGELLGTADVEASGDWVFVPDRPLPPGGLEITLGEAGKPGTAEDSFIVVIDEDRTSQPLVVASTPGQASEILQGLTAPVQVADVPEAAAAPATSQTEQPGAPAGEPASDVNAVEVRIPAEEPTEPDAAPAPTEETPASPALLAETPAVEETPEATPPAVEPPAVTPAEPAAASEPATPAETPANVETAPAVEAGTEVEAEPQSTDPAEPAPEATVAEPAGVEPATEAPAPAEPVEPAVETAEPANAEPAAPVETAATTPDEIVPAEAAPTVPMEQVDTPAIPQPALTPPTIDAIELDGGRTFFAGAGPEGGIMRLYVDDAFIADAIVEGGRWLIEAGPVLDKPSQRVRVDLIQADNAQVVSRAEVDFVVDLPASEPDIAIADADVPAVETEPPAASNPPVDEPAPTELATAESATTEPVPSEPAPAAPEAVVPASPEIPATAPAAPAEPAASNEPAAPAASTEPATGVETAVPSATAEPAAPAQNAAEPTAEPGPAADPVAEPAVPTMVAVSLGDPDAQRFASGKAIIRRGDNLWTIARRVYGEGLKYTTIYQANTGQIRDPDRIYPGQVFDLPTDGAE